MTEPTERMVKKGVEAYRKANFDPASPDTVEHKVTETYRAMETERKAEEAEKKASGMYGLTWESGYRQDNLAFLYESLYGVPRR